MRHLWHSNSKLLPLNTAEVSQASLRKRKFFRCRVQVAGAHPELLAVGEGKALLPPTGLSGRLQHHPNLLALLLLRDISEAV